MFDHVAIAVSDLEASERFYRMLLGVLGHEPVHADGALVEWEDWDIGRTDAEHPVSQGVRVTFRAPDHASVDAFWRAGVDAGYATDGALLLDPDGNSVEAVHRERDSRAPAACIDHLWIRVSDLDASRRFYLTIAPHAGLSLTGEEPGHVQLSGADYDLSLVQDDGPVTRHVHIAFPAAQNAAVDAFHAAVLAAGYADNGAPGERAVYHPGYYGAFVLDPDGLNVEVVNHNRG